MKDIVTSFDPKLSRLEKSAWFEAVFELADEHGYYQTLGDDHTAVFIDAGPKLIVTFESYEKIQGQKPKQEPIGFTYVRQNGWSHLCILSDAPSFSRHDQIYGYFDRLVDDGFFEDFDEVLFLGAFHGAYAAAAYSVVAPGARVLALQPVATVDPSVAGWDTRFLENRRDCFTDRYGFAPDMIEGTDATYLIYDPYQRLDAMHAALFRGPNVHHLPVRLMGGQFTRFLEQMNILDSTVEAAMSGTLSNAGFGAAYRARRESQFYLRRLISKVSSVGRNQLAARACRWALERSDSPQIAKTLEDIEARPKD